MDIFDVGLKRIKELPMKIDQAIFDAVNIYKNELIDYQVNRQWFDVGEKADGEKIKPLDRDYPVYSQFTIREKRRKGQPINRVTQKNTGKYHNSVRIEVFRDSFKITSNPIDATRLGQKYGEGLLGIQDQYLREFLIKRIIPEIEKIL